MRRLLLPALVLLAVSACGGDSSGLPAVGTLERDRIEIVAEAHEVLLEVPVSEGQAVAAGTVVARQDDARLALAVTRAEAARTRAARRLDELVRGPRQEAIAEAQAGLEGARQRRVVEEREHARIAAIVERGLATPADLDAVQLRRAAAIAEQEQWQARVEALLEGATVEELDQSVAALAEADAVLDDARLAQSRLTLRAPRDGTVDAIPYKRGERPPAGAPVVVMLADQAPYARVYLPQAVRARVQVGSEAQVRVAGLAETYAGRVRAVSSQAAFTPYFALTERDRGRLVYVVEIVLEGAEASRLPNGLPVEADFPGLDGE